MVSFNESRAALARLGGRLRERRLQQGEPQALFAERIGVSVPTLRAMEQGAPTVAIGTWVLALWALGALDELERVLAPAPSLIAQLQARSRPPRQRAPRRSRQ
ncbi:MAG: helix-turn-helix domain-containing protein [Burkholderiales bacterium]|jgi:transcriptional regulator with XRE-family HTH domain|nr:helix-turn-helix domain-containing protein [Burkholderiales bacterium]